MSKEKNPAPTGNKQTASKIITKNKMEINVFRDLPDMLTLSGKRFAIAGMQRELFDSRYMSVEIVSNFDIDRVRKIIEALGFQVADTMYNDLGNVIVVITEE